MHTESLFEPYNCHTSTATCLVDTIVNLITRLFILREDEKNLGILVSFSTVKDMLIGCHMKQLNLAISKLDSVLLQLEFLLDHITHAYRLEMETFEFKPISDLKNTQRLQWIEDVVHHFNIELTRMYCIRRAFIHSISKREAEHLLAKWNQIVQRPSKIVLMIKALL